MVVIYLGVLGLMAFIMGVAILGVWLRKHPSKANAEKSSRIMHFLFFAGLVAPGLISIFILVSHTLMDSLASIHFHGSPSFSSLGLFW